ncbi:helix-turn-helix domain-containing protein [Rufibacter sediminis]|uniref:Helix-turn-helix transcriptional regulator n=1 Tax=Rufibacter sediminis TaxID=2762756 RepID=A0ABR6VUP1_9BACT|nr:helix-turn-helix transcriptional regulator [Rufibacter sediminis]MBC3540630.1 helix-turn-helix transcriptional regulator [Rufibacter sediminis]
MKKPYMTPEEMKERRQGHYLSQRELAEVLRLNSGRAVRAYEAGEREISGPISVCMDLIDAFGLKKVLAALHKRKLKKGVDTKAH